MFKKIFLFLLIGFNILFMLKVQAQKSSKRFYFDQKDFEKNKILENSYHLWWNKYDWGFAVKDTLPYFVNDNSYKGIINYGVEYRSKDYKLFNFFENKTMYFLHVEIERCQYITNDSIVNIEGFVSGGWGNEGKVELHEPQNYIEIFVGVKTDTISKLLYNYSMNEDKIETIWKDKVIHKGQVLDSFPSFYFKTPKYIRTESSGRRSFKIKTKIEKNSIIVFGGSGCYSEIFDIGSMIFLPKKNSKVKIKKKEKSKSINLIVNNIHLENEKSEKSKAKETNYYTYTEAAENFIIRNQYAMAKKTYLGLDRSYKTLFARDIHNAIRCAILSRDYDNAYLWSERLSQKGVNFKYFDSKIFDILKSKKEWFEFSLRYDSIYRESNHNQNIALKLQIEQLLVQDQSNYGLNKRKDDKTLYETTELITTELINILKQEGFPSEERIGVYVKNDTVLDYSPEYNVIIRHAIQQNPKNLGKLLEILNKSYDNLKYDKIRSSNHRNFLNSCLQIYNGKVYSDKTCGKNELMIRKIKFMFDNKYQFIMDYGNFIRQEYIEKNSEELDKLFNEKFRFVFKVPKNYFINED